MSSGWLSWHPSRMRWKIVQISVFLTLFVASTALMLRNAGIDDYLLQGPAIPIITALYCYIVICVIFSLTLRIQLWLDYRRSRRIIRVR